MHTSSLLAVISLFLIGSFSLPQPENLEATRTIENREAKIPAGNPGGSIAIHSKGAEWYKHEKHGGESSASNGTNIKEREAHYKKPTKADGAEFFDHKHPAAPSNSTKIKEREAQSSDSQFGPPDGMTWMEFKKHGKHMKHEGGDGPGGGGVNSTTVRMVKFRG